MELSRLQGKLLAEGLHNVSNLILTIREMKGMSYPAFTKMVELKICDCLKVTSLPSLGKLSILRRLEHMPGWEEWTWRWCWRRNSQKYSLTSLKELGVQHLSSNLCEFLTVPKSNYFQRRAPLARLDSCISVTVHLRKNCAKRVAEFRIQPFGRLTNFDVPQHLVDRYRNFKVLNPST
ncbi:hypothetical protein D5086_022775 [Populus alba]|uniref:Uncharacterized protein n=1 Tax=Populus alba TaxID=43335 RepID=A0ACC4B9G5_POPAL